MEKNEIIENFIRQLGDDRFTYEKNERDFFSFSYSFVPDVTLIFCGKPLAAIDIINRGYNDFDYKISLGQLQRYCVSKRLSFGLVLWVDSATLLIESDGFKENDPIQPVDAATMISTRMRQITERDISMLASRFLEKLKSIAKTIAFQDTKTIERIEKLTVADLDWANIQLTQTTLTLSPSFERKLFSAILGTYNCSELCRYTTREGLFRIISNKKQSLCSIIGMNDKSECYYVDNYLLRWKEDHFNFLTYKENALLNRCFITSGSRLDNESLEHKMFDDLTMWRMYADDCRGVCVKYRIDRDKLGEKYVLAPISYAKKRYITEPYDFDSEEIIGEESIHPELDFIHALMFCKEGGYEYRYSTFSFWKHFFKSFEYKDEQEVRLMYFADEDENVKWIQANDVFCPIIEKPIEKGKSEYPLQISEIVLGPKFHEREVNEKQLEYILSHENIDCFEGFECNQSMIDNYR